MSWFYRLLCKLLPFIVIMKDGKPYLTRWFLNGIPNYTPNERKLYLHRFHQSDRDRALHNHPWPGHSLILKGGYYEERRTLLRVHTDIGGKVTHEYSPSSFKKVGFLSRNHLSVNDFHCATLLNEDEGAWTLFWTGKRSQDWGFLTREDEKYTPWREFLVSEDDEEYRKLVDDHRD